jgi:protein-tyrosine-phosphatase
MPTCLFVCPDNALTSRLAEGAFNAGAPRGWRSTSAGLVAASAVSPRAASWLGAQGLPVPEHEPRSVERDLVSFMRVVVAIAIPPETDLPDWLAPKIDLRMEVLDPKELSDPEAGEWFTLLGEEMEKVVQLCRERTPRPFG